MPGLVRKVIICAAVDGLILQPISSRREQRPPSPVKIRYGGDAVVEIVPRDSVSEVAKNNSSFEAFGIVGLISVAKHRYLISITRRQQVAIIRGFPVYVVTEVAITPCTSQRDATDAVDQTSTHLNKKTTDTNVIDGAETEDETDIETASLNDAGDDDSVDEQRLADAQQALGRRSSVAEDVISKKGSYGRFAQRWFSKSGWTQDQKRNLGLSNAEAKQADPPTAKVESTKEAAEQVGATGTVTSLLPKLLRTAQIYFGSSRSFYFSYDYNITRSLPSQHKSKWTDMPLHKAVDPLFFWNSHPLKPFIDAGVEWLALPVMQGFVGQRSFVVDNHPPQNDEGTKDSVEMQDFAPASDTNPTSQEPEPSPSGKKSSERTFDIVVISRRSIKRAGLRYMRRGVDEQGNVANSVETEQILSPSVPDASSKMYSFVQIRGSIPQFFTQSPYSLKPAPILQHSDEANYAALKKHFVQLQERYGKIQTVNLIEKHGVEAIVGDRFQHNAARFNDESADDKGVPFEWFDFHQACRGMKFENVSLLVDTLAESLDTMGQSVVINGSLASEQKGVFRTNCMDCLDRTNVCQSSFAKYMLDLQLKEQGYDMTVQRDQENAWFNTLWADNGDAVSKQYASTGAMKGDYTRTRKRDYRGVVADVGLSLTRFYNGIVNDYFLQVSIDFFLGNVTSMVFDEFEANMMTKDPAVSMEKMREQAIELSQKRVVEDESEDFVAGWTMLSPHAAGSVSAHPLEEVVLLLTEKALYLCRFDWNMDKVSSFERVDYTHVEHILFGTYITSTISAAAMDEDKNVGLVITYRPGSNDTTRINTRSISSRAPTMEKDSTALEKISTEANSAAPVGFAGLLSRRPNAPTEKKIALKALYTQSSMASSGESSKPTEIQQVVSICAEVERLTKANKPVFSGEEKKELIEKGEIISLADAKKSTGLLDQLGYSIKRMVWA